MLASERLMERESQGMPAEAALVRAAQAGDRTAFDRLIAAHATALIRTAYVILHDQDEAEDVAQETLIAAYRNLATYRHDAPFGAWLHRIAVNRSYDLVRKRQRQSRLIDEIKAESPGSDEDNAVREARANEQSAMVRDLIQSLDEKNRAIVALRFLEGLSIKDVADALGMPEGTIKRRIHDVLKVLRTRMTEGEGASR